MDILRSASGVQQNNGRAESSIGSLPEIAIDIEKLIGNLVIQQEILKAQARAERTALLAKIAELEGLTSKSSPPDDSPNVESTPVRSRGSA